MKSYLLSLVGAILISAVVSALVSENKMGRFIRGMARLFVFATVALPLLSLFGGDGYTFGTGTAETDETYLKTCSKLLEEELEGEVAAYLEEVFSVEAEVDAAYGAEYALMPQKITAILSPGRINGQDEHINMIARIEEALKKRYGCEAEVVWSSDS